MFTIHATTDRATSHSAIHAGVSGPEYDQDQSTTTPFGHTVVLKFQDHHWALSSDWLYCGPSYEFVGLDSLEIYQTKRK